MTEPSEVREPMNEVELDALLQRARGEAQSLESVRLGIHAAAITALLISAVRGLVAMHRALPAERAMLMTLGTSLAIVLALCLFVWGARIQRRAERARHAVFVLQVARDALDRGDLQQQETHPYRGVEGVAASPRSKPSEAPARPRRSSLRPIAAALAIVAAIVVLGGAFGGAAPRAKQRWTFLDASTAPSDHGLVASTSQAGAWAVEDHEAATGARALVNREGHADAPPATIVARSVWLRDFSAVTRCKAAAARDVRQCGLVFRFVDDANYELVRLDMVDKSVTFAVVTGGKEREVATARAEAAPDTWQELRVDATGGTIRVAWNGRPILEAVERIPAARGRVGLWAASTAIAFFDELTIEELPDAPRALEVLPLFSRTRS